MSLSFEKLPALVLNADYRPLSYFPLSLWPWRDAVRAAFLERVDVVAEYDREARSPSRRIRLPSVISLKAYAPATRRAAFTRFNVFLRDEFRCQYCNRRQRAENLTFDHVIPRSRGGVTGWRNVVAACAPCNLRKGDRTAAESGMRPRHAPRMPGARELREIGRRFPPNYLHESWRDYLYWDTVLESDQAAGDAE